MSGVYDNLISLSRYVVSIEPLKVFDYQKTHTFEKRKIDATKLKAKYPNRCPIICEVAATHRKALQLDSCKYLVPKDLTFGQFIYLVRRRIKLTPEKGLYIFNEQGNLPASAHLISQIENTCMNADGFVYLVISMEDTYG
jgi:GABA(A) receptor-associated protein